MIVSDYIEEKFCLVELIAQDKESAIREVAQVINTSGKIGDYDKFITMSSACLLQGMVGNEYPFVGDLLAWMQLIGLL